MRTVRDVVAWTVEPTPPEVTLAAGAGRLVNALWVVGTLGAGATGAPPPPYWSLPDDPDAYAGLGVVTLRGSAPWLPPARRRSLVRASATGAFVVPDPASRPPVRVPLEALRVTGATSRGRSRHRRHATAPWTLALAGPQAALELSGAWLALAFLGSLAGWPEP